MKHKLTFLFIFMFSLAQAATTDILVRSENFNEHKWEKETIYYFDSLGLPKNLNPLFLKTTLQSFYDNFHGIAFRHLGDWRDFDHGHLLTDGSSLRAILFHTQERASIAPQGSPYSYLNKDLRNWIVFMDYPNQIQNARLFKFATKPKFWGPQLERNVTWEQYEHYGTVVELMLDPVKMGFQVLPIMNSEKTESFHFKRARCPKVVNPKSNIIAIETKEGPMCLYVTTMACTFKSHFKCPGKPAPF